MLRFAFVLAILSVLFSRSESQLIKEYGIKVGVATINQYWHYSSSEFVNVNNSPRQGVDAGIFVEWFNVPLISLLTEVHYIQNGKSSLINVSDGDIYTNLINYYSLFPSDYLSVPLLVKIRLEETILTPYILAGPRFDFYFNNRNDEFGIYALDGSRQVDIGGTFGIGVETSSILPIHLGAEFRYSPNFRDNYPLLFSDISINNRALEFLLVLSY